MAKKTFIDRDNPAYSFLSITEDAPASEDPIPQRTGKPPEGYKVNPLYIEKKTRRLQLVLQPSLYERVKVVAAREGKSVNNYIHTILEEETREE